MMSSTFEPKWTSGPWLYRAKSGSWHVEPPADTNYTYGFPFIETLDSCDMYFHNDHDAELIALAPELAAAVLDQFSDVCHCDPDEWDEGGEGCLTFQCINTCVKTEQRLRDVYWRLRMIGADDAGKCYCDTDDSSRCDGTCTRMIGADE